MAASAPPVSAAPVSVSMISTAAEPTPVYYDKNAFVTTKFGNKISKKSVLCGSAQIIVKGKTIIEMKAVIRGDLAVITVGQCSLIGENSVIRPPDHRFGGKTHSVATPSSAGGGGGGGAAGTAGAAGGGGGGGGAGGAPTAGAVHFLPVSIGDHTIIEADCVIEAANIGNCVHIGRGSIIGKRCILSDCCVIEPNSVLPAGTVVPPFCVFGGSPALLITKLPESYQSIALENTTQFFANFLPKKE